MAGFSFLLGCIRDKHLLKYLTTNTNFAKENIRCVHIIFFLFFFFFTIMLCVYDFYVIKSVLYKNLPKKKSLKLF